MRRTQPRTLRYVDGYVKENKANWTPKTHASMVSTFNSYGDWCTEQGVDAFVRASANRFKTEVIMAGERSPKTMNDHLGRLSSLFGWALRHGHTSLNVFDGLGIRRKKDERKSARQGRDLLPSDQMTKLVSLLTPATDPQLWLPTILLHTGARSGEIAQLNLDDVKTEEGIVYFDLHARGDGMSLKTPQSERRIPAHSRLLSLGLMAHIKARREAGEIRLFDWSIHPTNGAAHYPGKWYARWRKRNGIGGDLHVLRHQVASALYAAEVPMPVIADLLGHENPGETLGRYAKAAPLTVLQTAIEKLSFS